MQMKKQNKNKTAKKANSQRLKWHISAICTKHILDMQNSILTYIHNMLTNGKKSANYITLFI